MLGRTSRTKKTMSDFFSKIWISINGTQQCGIGSPKINRSSTCGLSTGPPDLGVSQEKRENKNGEGLSKSANVVE